MPKIAYVEKALSKRRMERIEWANLIIAQYARDGYTLTLRQLYYQFVSRSLIENNQGEYKRLGEAISDGRRLGLIDWSAIEDRTRNLRSVATWSSPGEIVEACAHQFRMDLWETQRRRIEVWVEKDALLGVMDVACSTYQVPYFSCRGYASDSEVWAAAQRFRRWRSKGQIPLVIHLGDHDPSGLDMSRDIEERLTLFAGDAVEVRRIALNRVQIDEFKPPPNPAKTTDARFADYQRRHGDDSWELDALDPSTLTRLIRAEIELHLQVRPWAAMVKTQDRHRATLERVASDLVKGKGV